jgi:hypothetical protein
MKRPAEFQNRMQEYQQKMGSTGPAKRLSDDPNTQWLENQFGRQLDAMPLSDQIALLSGKKFAQAWARRLGKAAAESDAIRPEMLLAIHRQSEAQRRTAGGPAT